MKRTTQRRRSRAWRYGLAIVILAGYGSWALLRPLPALRPLASAPQLTLPTPASALTWPVEGQSAVGVLGNDSIETRGTQTPVPTASTAKIITALVVLNEKPLRLNEVGPTITLTADDVARYSSYLAQDGSVLPVQAGEQLTEYQMLQALLLPSANNIADTLASWAYGSHQAYAAAANAYLAEHGLANTRVGSDASGLAPDTVSTARDLVRLGQLALQQPVLKQIVSQPHADGFPVAGTIRNVNNLLGNSGIIGIKTGNSDQAGGTFIGAALVDVAGRAEIVITAVLGAPNRPSALQQSLALIQSAKTNFKSVKVVKRGEIIGRYQLPWAGSVVAVADQDLTVSAWGGAPLKANGNLKPIDAEQAKAGQTVGKLSARAETIPLKLKTTPAEPSPWWRLTHPF